MQCAEFDNPGLRAALVLVVTALMIRPTEIVADVVGSPQPSTISATTDASVIAALVDRMIGDALDEQKVTPAGLTSDEDFLRRVTLDLVGRIPSANDVTLFSLNPDPDKRSGVIESLLSSDEFARTWASYWRDVIFSRATEMRSRVTQRPFEEWMTDQLEAGRPWNEIVTELLTATGNTQEEGRTALISAHNGDPAELASEASRIFLGIQMQCANCHNHPYDSWTREDFHELAAFFPRIRMRRDPSTQPAAFIVESADDVADSRQRDIDPQRLFQLLDRNRDGRITKREAQQSRQFGMRFERLIEAADKNKDEAISLDELKDAPRPSIDQMGRGSAEYYMPDLDDPTSRGTRIQPTFFVDHTSVPFGTTDLDRRLTLASLMTSTDNPWFARAFVNRIWAEMLGAGFYMPVDDLGPQREAVLPDVLDALASGFVASGYDIKWVFRTIANTQAYQRRLDPSAESGPALFAAASPTRLRSDQIYHALQEALGTGSLMGRRGLQVRGPGGVMAAPGDAGRIVFNQLFGFDPSTPQDDVMGTIPQALFLMNSPITALAINGRGPTMLGRLLREFPDDTDGLSELYLRVLSREPTEAELSICREHLRQVSDRQQAFEDILWSLLNSSEFLTKR